MRPKTKNRRPQITLLSRGVTGLCALLTLSCSADEDPAAADSAPGTGGGPEAECSTNTDCAGVVTTDGPCELAVCIAGAGVCEVTQLSGTPCDDGDVCTTDDFCSSGQCTPGAPLECDDDPCIAAHSCVSGECRYDPVDCDDANPCTDDSCEPLSGCVHAANTEPCDDGLSCTTDDACAAGACQSGESDCPCAADADCASFDDGNPCNGVAFCDLGEGPGAGTCEVHPGTVVVCAPSEPCQLATCNPATGACESAPAPDGNPCDDGDVCTASQSCVAGVCTADSAPCDDGIPCTVDTCGAGGCTHAPDDAACDDASDCTTDLCQLEQGCLTSPNGSCGGCEGIACLPCGQGGSTACGGFGQPIPGTCCTIGDPLLYLAKGQAAEAVDVEADDTYAYLCGGFGVRVNKISNPSAPKMVDSKLGRCQRIGLGPTLTNGNRVVYFAHHGDSWVSSPFMATHHMQPTDQLIEVNRITDDQILFEGLRWHQGHLYVGAHGGGVRVYVTDDQGIPSLLTVVAGFENAWKIDAAEGVAWVADMEGGLKVLDISAPADTQVVQSLATPGAARDVVGHNGRVYVALGGNGIAVFDAADPQALVLDDLLDVGGSAQAVAAQGSVLAVGAWSHLAAYDTATLALLGTEDVKFYPQFEQVFGVAVQGDILYAAEWEGLHIVQHMPGQVAADLWIQEELLDFGIGAKPTRGVLVRNRGHIDLVISSIEAQPADKFSVEPTQMTVAPGGVGLFEVTFTPPTSSSFNVTGTVKLKSNDPDPGQNPFQMKLTAGASGSQINVGEPIGQDFAFLDPTGANQLSNVKGNVVVLAYFALF